MAPAVPGGPAAVGALATFLGLAGLYCWNRQSQLNTKYDESYRDYQSYLWSEFSSELGELVTEINQQTDYEPADEDEDILPPKSKLVTTIENKIGRNRLSEIEDSLRVVDEPRELRSAIESELGSTFVYFFLSSGAFFVLSFLLLGPSTDGIVAIQAAFLIGGFYSVIEAIQKFYSAWVSERELDKRIREYHEPL